MNMVDEIDDGTFKMELLIPSKSERLRILSNHSNKNDPENKQYVTNFVLVERTSLRKKDKKSL